MPFDLKETFALNISPKKLLEMDRLQGDTPDPAPYRTLGDVIELERRRHEREAEEQTEVTFPEHAAQEDLVHTG